MFCGETTGVGVAGAMYEFPDGDARGADVDVEVVVGLPAVCATPAGGGRRLTIGGAGGATRVVVRAESGNDASRIRNGGPLWSCGRTKTAGVETDNGTEPSSGLAPRSGPALCNGPAPCGTVVPWSRSLLCRKAVPSS
jgi:hypothetical protein